MSIDVNRRFYRDAVSVPVSGGWGIALDGKTVKTPARNDLTLQSPALAAAIAAEWSAQEDRIRPHTMPLTQLVSTAIDRVGPERTRIVAETAGYAVSDLVSFRAEMPADLVARQRLTWDPLIAWMRDRFDVAFQVTAGVMPVAQLPATLAKLERVVSAQDNFRLTALATLTGAAGSLVIGLAVLEGRLGPQEAATAAQLDELYQAEFWGIDPEAEIRRAGQRADIVHARRFLDLLAAD